MRLVTSGCVAWLIAAALSAQPTGLHAEFTRLEEVWNTAHRHADAETLAALWADILKWSSRECRRCPKRRHSPSPVPAGCVSNAMKPRRSSCGRMVTPPS